MQWLKDTEGVSEPKYSEECFTHWDYEWKMIYQTNLLLISGFVQPKGPYSDHILAGKNISNDFSEREINLDVGQR